MTSLSQQIHKGLNYVMEVQCCNCCDSRKVSLANHICSPSCNHRHDSTDDNLTAARHITFNVISQKHECISPYTSDTISGESNNRNWHHRWRRRSTSFSCCKCETLMNEKFPTASFYLSTEPPKNPSSQEDIVKLSFLTATKLALVIATSFIPHSFYFGACMRSPCVLLFYAFLVSLFYQFLSVEAMLKDLICGSYASNSSRHLLSILNLSLKKLQNLYSIVKKKVVERLEYDSAKKKRSKSPGKSNTLPSKSASSAVFFWYAALLAISQSTVSGMPARPEEADHVTAIDGDWVALNCDVNFPDGHVVPYVVQWWRKDKDLPIYIWYDDYPSHIAKEYRGRVERVDTSNRQYGLASLNLTRVTGKDRGWYNCKVLFLDRGPDATVNGTWYHLDVHATPHFVQKPDNIVYVSIRDSIILVCQAAGTPTPEVLWFKGEHPVRIHQGHIGIFNDGTELRISGVREDDLGDYTCIARNGEGRIHHITKMVLAGGAVITKPPYNKTALESTEVTFPCKGEANPANLSTAWFRWVPVTKSKLRDDYSNNARMHQPQLIKKPLRALNNYAGRYQVKSDGTLVLSDVNANDEGKYTCQISNGIGKPISASAYLAVEYKARVSFNPTHQYIPRGLQGMIQCYILANPPVQFVTWTKNKRIYDPFEEEGVMALPNGTILIDKVGPKHQGEYTCIPYNIRGSEGKSNVMVVEMRDPPQIVRRPEAEYPRTVGGKVTMPCQAAGPPKVNISWRRVDGRRLPRKRHKIFNGELTLENLRKTDHGVYECVVTNDVATIVARSALLIERTTPHAPRNVTVTHSETFAVTIEWMPGYSGCAVCRQEYKIRYREKDSKFPNWIELPVNPPDARKIQIHNLSANTKYEFQVIGTNEYGDGMFSEIIEASTRGLAYFDIEDLPRDPTGKIIFPSIPQEQNGAPGEKPGAATNLTINQEAGGWVLRWLSPKDDSNILYYTIQHKQDSQDGEWNLLTDAQIDKDEASYMIKNIGTAKAYLFRVFSHTADKFTISEELKYDLPEGLKARAVTAGLIGGLLFFIVAIILSVCTVKICNKRRRRKQERAYNMVAQRAADGDMIDGDTLKRHGKRRVPVVSFGGVDVEGYSSYYNDDPDGGSSAKFKRLKYRKHGGPNSLRRGLLSVFDTASNCVQSLHDRVGHLSIKDSSATEGFYDSNLQYGYDSDELDYSGGRRRTKKVGKSSSKSSSYSLQLEYPTQPGYGVNRGPKSGFISRTQEGKFVIDPNEDPFNTADEQQRRRVPRSRDDDEGGFEVELPPNRFRTRSVAIVAGYSPERLYSNMPAGAFVVESGMYKMNRRAEGGEQWERPEAVYWKQVVFGSRNARAGSDGSGTLPRYRRLPQEPPSQPQVDDNQRHRLVGQIVDEDLRRLRALDPNNNAAANQALAQQAQQQSSHPFGSPVTNLSGIWPNYQFQQPSYSNITAISGGDENSTRLIGTENLEIIRQRPANVLGQHKKSPKLRASSPIDQHQHLALVPGGVGSLADAGGAAWPPMSPELSPFNSQVGMASNANLGHFDSDISSVPHLSSNERSIPSTLLTGSSTGLGSSMERTQSNSSRSLSRKTTPSGTMGSLSTGPGMSTMTSELGTIHEDENSMYHPHQQLQQLTPHSPTSIVQADVHKSQVATSSLVPFPNRPKDIEKQIYWSRETYRNADSMFPNYALNYPTPVHGSISPSRQYPPRWGYEQEMAGVFPNQYPYVQHPYQYYLNPELQQQHSQQPSMTNVFTTSQFAQPQSPTTVQHEAIKKHNIATTPLATSSPPISRRSHSSAYHNQGYQHDTILPSQVQKHSAPAHLAPYVDNTRLFSAAQITRTTSPEHQLHDYENMRYSTQTAYTRNDSQQSTHSSGPSPAPRPVSGHRHVQLPQPPVRPRRQRDIPTHEANKQPAPSTRRERKAGTTSKLSVVTAPPQPPDLPPHSRRSSASQTPVQGATSQSDAVSLVSEVLDAEVTALTNSSSPGSSIGSGKHPRVPLRYYQGASKMKSQIPGSAKEQQMLDQSYSLEDSQVTTGTSSGPAAEQSTTSGSSGIASKNTSASQNQSTASAGTSSSGGVSKTTGGNVLSDVLDAKKLPHRKKSASPLSRQDILGSDAPSYENWPPASSHPSVPQQAHVTYMPSTDQHLGIHSPITTLIPPLHIHQSQLQHFQQSVVLPTSNITTTTFSSAPYQQPPHYYFRSSPGGGTEFVDIDSSLDGTAIPLFHNVPPQSFVAVGSSVPNVSGGSRPGSSHSAPMLDLSIDRHYEFDAARTPTDDLGHVSDTPTAQLPRNWNRPYLGYNPRVRDRELGSAAELARSEHRVFSDSEIYSPVFPRGRPLPTGGFGDPASAAAEAVSARVEAMRKEFAEYQREQTIAQSRSPDMKPAATSTTTKNKKASQIQSSPPIVSVQGDTEEIEIPLRAPKLQRPPSMSPPPPPSNTSPFLGIGSSSLEVENIKISGPSLTDTKDYAPTSTSGTTSTETGTNVSVTTHATTAMDDDRLESLI